MPTRWRRREGRLARTRQLAPSSASPMSLGEERLREAATLALCPGFPLAHWLAATVRRDRRPGRARAPRASALRGRNRNPLQRRCATLAARLILLARGASQVRRTFRLELAGENGGQLAGAESAITRDPSAPPPAPRHRAGAGTTFAETRGAAARLRGGAGEPSGGAPVGSFKVFYRPHWTSCLRRHPQLPFVEMCRRGSSSTGWLLRLGGGAGRCRSVISVPARTPGNPARTPEESRA